MVSLIILVFSCSLVMFQNHLSSTRTSNVFPQLGTGSKGFCQGMFMAMAMSGFQWSFLGKEPGDCLNYLAPAWKLDDQGKFQGAMVYTILLGVLTEGTYAFQGLLQPYVPKRLWHLVHSLLYGIQRFMGYILMFVAMTFSWELFFSVIVGIILGRLLFPNVTQRERLTNARQVLYETPVSRADAPPTLATTSLDDSQHHLDVGAGSERESLLTGDALTVRRRR